MTTTRTVSVLGGDSRQIYAAERLAELGYSVTTFGFENISRPVSLPKAVSMEQALESGIILLPLPVSKNNKTLNASFAEHEIYLKDIIEAMPYGRLVLMGMAGESFIRELLGTGAQPMDYFRREELTVKNALLTAEGIVEIVMEKLPVAVYGLRAAITGYGRVGFFTAKLLKSLGADVTVFARDRVQRVKAETAGLTAKPLTALKKEIGEFSCVINTVPASVISADTVASSGKDCLFIESASAPYGIDFDACRDHGRNLVRAFSLPGKTSPKTAGIMIADTVHGMIGEVM